MDVKPGSRSSMHSTPAQHVSSAHLLPALPRFSECVTCQKNRVCLLAGGESRHLAPAHAGPRARAGWAAGRLAGRTWSALLCLQPLLLDSLIDDLRCPALLTGQQQHLGGSGQVNLPTLLHSSYRWRPLDGLRCYDIAPSPGSILSANHFLAFFKSWP